MFELLKLESKPETTAERLGLWDWVRSHPMLAIGALVLVTLVFAPSQPQAHHPGDSAAEEPPLFI